MQDMQLTKSGTSDLNGEVFERKLLQVTVMGHCQEQFFLI
jgi:hypothetical protein